MAAIPCAADRFVDSRDGTRLAVYQRGNPGGPTVVLVHGWPDSHVLWDGVVPVGAEGVAAHRAPAGAVVFG